MVQTNGSVRAVVIEPDGSARTVETEIDFDFLATTLGGAVEVQTGKSDLTLLSSADGGPPNLWASRLTENGRGVAGTVIVAGPTVQGVTEGLSAKGAEAVLRMVHGRS